MLLFAFDVMDVDSGGEIDGDEMTRCLVEVSLPHWLGTATKS